MGIKLLTLISATTLLFVPAFAHSQIIEIPPEFLCLPLEYDPETGECIEVSPDPEPIIIIPGILVSYNPDVILLDGENTDNWGFAPTTFNIYRGLIERLEQAGLDVYVAHYDWRRPAADNSFTYLKSTIEEAKAQSNSARVDIVAHSFGGLVARDYIQSPQYGGDVDQLITIGTPHKGSADAYLAHEGGILPDRWSPSTRVFLTTVENSLKTVNGTLPFPRRPESFRTFFPSLQDLIPTEPFVVKNDDLLPIDQMQTHNSYLANRNHTLEADLASTGVELTTLAGTGLATLENIPTGEISVIDQLADSVLSRWRDGHPTPDPPQTDSTMGDRTVLLSSASLFSIDPVSHVPHDKLPEDLQEEVLGLLNNVDITGSHLAYDLPDSILSTTVLSPLTPTIEFPDGTIFTCDHSFTQADASCLLNETNPNDPKLLTILNPPPGDYTLTYTGTGNGDYTVITTYADQDETLARTTQGTAEPTTQFEENISIHQNSISLIDDADYHALLKELAQHLRKLKRHSEIHPRALAKAQRHLSAARVSLRQYERSVRRQQERRSERRLAAYHRRLDHLSEVVPDDLKQIVEKIKAHSPAPGL